MLPTELLEAIRSLYRRARENALVTEDITSLADVRVDETADFLERIYFNREEFDRHLGDFGKTYDIFRGFTADQTVLDVGAHWGYSAVAMRHQGCKSKIISIEALATNVPSLMRLKSIDNGMYEFYNIAASETDRTIRFFIPVINGHASTGLSTTGGTLGDDWAFLLAQLASRHKPLQGGVDEVRLAIADIPALPIDTIADRVGPIVAVKMDVEGHEAHALQGAHRLLACEKPLLMVEGGNTDEQVVAQMVAHGYFYCERRDGKLAPHAERSVVHDGFWLHPEKVAFYRDLGIFDSAAEAG
jgi:FkbM family methyltransferase